jgi:hypothetical protein
MVHPKRSNSPPCLAAAFSASDDHDAALHIPSIISKSLTVERLAIQEVSGVCLALRLLLRVFVHQPEPLTITMSLL